MGGGWSWIWDGRGGELDEINGTGTVGQLRTGNVGRARGWPLGRNVITCRNKLGLHSHWVPHDSSQVILKS